MTGRLEEGMIFVVSYDWWYGEGIIIGIVAEWYDVDDVLDVSLWVVISDIVDIMSD